MTSKFILFISGVPGNVSDAHTLQFLNSCPPEVTAHITVQAVNALPSNAVPPQARTGVPVVFDTAMKQFSDADTVLPYLRSQALARTGGAAVTGAGSGGAGGMMGAFGGGGGMAAPQAQGPSSDQALQMQQAANRAALLQRTIGPGAYGGAGGAGMAMPMSTIGGMSSMSSSMMMGGGGGMTPASLQAQAMHTAGAQPYGGAGASMHSLLQGYNPNVLGMSDRNQRGMGDSMFTDPRMQPGTQLPHSSQMAAPFMAVRHGVPMPSPMGMGGAGMMQQQGMGAPGMGMGMGMPGQQTYGLTPDQMQQLAVKTARFKGGAVAGALSNTSRVGASIQQAFQTNSAIDQPMSQMDSMAVMDAQFEGQRTGYNVLTGNMPSYMSGNQNGKVLVPEFDDHGAVDGATLEAVAQFREEHTQRILARQRGCTLNAIPDTRGGVDINAMKRISEARSSQVMPAPRNGFQPAPLTAIDDKISSKMNANGGQMMLRPPIGASGMYGQPGGATYGAGGSLAQYGGSAGGGYQNMPMMMGGMGMGGGGGGGMGMGGGMGGYGGGGMGMGMSGYGGYRG